MKFLQSSIINNNTQLDMYSDTPLQRPQKLCVKKWRGGRAPRWGVCNGGRVPIRVIFFAIIGANMCNLVHFGVCQRRNFFFKTWCSSEQFDDIRSYQNWDGKSTLFHPTATSRTEFTILAYRLHGHCTNVHCTSKSHATTAPSTSLHKLFCLRRGPPAQAVIWSNQHAISGTHRWK